MYEEVQVWLNKYPAEVDWSTDSEFTKEQVSKILESEDGKMEVLDELWEGNIDYAMDLEEYALKEAISEFDLELEPEELREYVDVPFDMNIEQLTRYTRAYICIDLRLEHLPHWDEYEDVEEELEFWGVNPHDIDESWPDIPGREPKISAKDLYEVWINCNYHSGWHALLDGREVLEAALKGTLWSMDTLEKGAYVTTHDYLNGASSVLGVTLADIPIDIKEIYNDGGNRYGIQACCGLIDEAWNGTLSQSALEIAKT